eukprot:NODE_17_length_48642_cov_1.199349.p29 type:complete len:201 gc:universal NODE_17_length_48642_cov_1.199349:25042-24440(-)
MLSNSNSKFKSKNYWEARYQNETSFEWFESRYNDILECISNILQDSTQFCTFLHIGCGNSQLGVDLQKELTINIDYSVVVISKMKSMFSCYEWSIIDITSIPIRSDSIDAIIDKGTLDALLCDANVWDPKVEDFEDACKALREIFRILSSDGVYIYATFGQPHFRKPIFKLCDLEVQKIYTLGKDFHYFVYVVKKIKVSP